MESKPCHEAAPFPEINHPARDKVVDDTDGNGGGGGRRRWGVVRWLNPIISMFLSLSLLMVCSCYNTSFITAVW